MLKLKQDASTRTSATAQTSGKGTWQDISAQFYGAARSAKAVLKRAKLDFRVRYDTDVDKVRKIIKKINRKIMKDPEMGPVMLDKLKSQGVRELDDSAMIMRVKFKTIPGEQFVIQREVFRMMQESFHENGIEFAHRNVTVYLPPGEAADESKNKVVEAGAAAAAAAHATEEEMMQQKKPK